MAARPLPPVEFLRECFDYEPETGVIRWKHRPDCHFTTAAIAKAWNSKLAGSTSFGSSSSGGHLQAELMFDGGCYRLTAGRVILKLMTGVEPDTVDHANGDPQDNRFENLRAATHQQNTWNLGKTRAASGLRGAFREGRKWGASVNIAGRRHRLGLFDTALEAHEAYCAYVREQRGEFANTGFNVFA